MMEVPINVLAKLVCENCEGYLSRGPVLMLDNGKSRCGRCSESEEGARRNLPYEALAKLLTFPCRYKENGCNTQVSFKKNRKHENACAFRPFVCPIAESGTCEWFGGRGDLLMHCQSAHPANVIENPHKLIHNIIKSSLDNYLLSAFHALFLFQTKVCVTSRKIYHSVRLIGDPRSVTKYKFTIAIENNGIKLIKPGIVAAQGCMALQEDTSVATGINNVLAEMGDYKDTVFTVTLESTDLLDAQNSPIETGTKKTVISEQQPTKTPSVTAQKPPATANKPPATAQKPPATAQNPPQSTAANDKATKKKKNQKKKKPVMLEVDCVLCKRKTCQIYRDMQGWLCEICAPAKRLCKYNNIGCTYTDIDSKCEKHEMYYCTFATRCQICMKNIERTTLDAHYTLDHANITCRVGAKFRINLVTDNTHYFIVNTRFGNVICLYLVDYAHFSLYVATPLTCEQWYQHRCSIAIKHPITERALTVLPVVKNYMPYDTVLNIQRSEFDQFVFNDNVHIQVEFL